MEDPFATGSSTCTVPVAVLFFGHILGRFRELFLINDFDKGWQVHNKNCDFWLSCLEDGLAYRYFSDIHFENGDYLRRL